MKIVFDASPLTGPKAGIYQYVDNLIRSLNSLDEDLQFNIYLGTKWSSLDILNKTSTQSYNRLNVIAKVFDVFGEKSKCIRKELNYNYQKCVLYKGLREYKPELIHFTGNYIYTPDIPAIVTVYDLSCFRLPQTHPYSRVVWQKKHLPKALKQASHIITISKFSKRELISYFNIEPNKISVIYCGVSQEFKPIQENLVNQIISKYSLQYKRYILSIGTVEPRKNLDTLIQAFINLPKNIKDNYKLVIIGAQGWKQDKLLKNYDKLIITGKLIFLGFVEQAHLPSLISGAILSAYPSLYEGFGLPVLESMSCRTPVIFSNTSSMPEISDDPEILVEPKDIKQWTELINKIIEDAEYAELLAISGLKRSKEFSWKITARQTMNAYKKVLCM